MSNSELRLIAIEEAYYNMAHILNKSDKVDEIIDAINKALRSLLNSIFNGIPANNYMAYNIILIASAFIKRNEEKYCYIESFCNLKTLLKVINSHRNKKKYLQNDKKLLKMM